MIVENEETKLHEDKSVSMKSVQFKNKQLDLEKALDNFRSNKRDCDLNNMNNLNTSKKSDLLYDPSELINKGNKKFDKYFMKNESDSFNFINSYCASKIEKEDLDKVYEEEIDNTNNSENDNQDKSRCDNMEIESSSCMNKNTNKMMIIDTNDNNNEIEKKSMPNTEMQIDKNIDNNDYIDIDIDNKNSNQSYFKKVKKNAKKRISTDN